MCVAHSHVVHMSEISRVMAGMFLSVLTIHGAGCDTVVHAQFVPADPLNCKLVSKIIASVR